MIDSEAATSVDDLPPAVCSSDVITNPSRGLDHCDDVTYDDAFLAGFRDCRREVLRYLRQKDADVSDELEIHLAAVERTCWRRRCDDGPRPGEFDQPADSGVIPSRRPDDCDDSALGVSLLADDELTTEDGLGQSSVSSELSENACDLMRLAQNNPRINNILNELFTLMDDDDDDDDCDYMMTHDDDDDAKQSNLDTSTSHDVISELS